eukprot:gene7527-11851_t
MVKVDKKKHEKFLEKNGMKEVKKKNTLKVNAHEFKQDLDSLDDLMNKMNVENEEMKIITPGQRNIAQNLTEKKKKTRNVSKKQRKMKKKLKEKAEVDSDRYSMKLHCGTMRKFLLLFIVLILFTCVLSEETVETNIKTEKGSPTDSTTDDSNLIKTATEKGQKFTFQAEINQLLGIIIHSLYTEKEIFLRELISNASDALDKIRFISLTDSKALSTNEKLEIRISADEEAGTISIRDSGVGMTAKDLATNLGTIAKSGTKSFIEKLKQTSDYSLIGQFGVGFYSGFMVSDRITVISKNNDDPDQHIWTSEADNSFTIVKDPRGNTLGRGTELILHLKKDVGAEYLKEDKLKSLVERYSEFTHFPIYLLTTKTETKEVPVEEEEEKKEEKDEKTNEKKEDDVKVEEEKKEKKTKKVEVKSKEWEVLNENKPIWTRDPKTITKDEYNRFFKAFSREYSDAMTHIHFTSEGTVGFKSLIFVPGKKPYSGLDFTQEMQNIKLYVKRVFITDSIKDFMPRYLNFIKGLVDSEDLPLHISRQDLQKTNAMNVIKRRVITKTINMFKRLAEDEDEEIEEYEKKLKETTSDDKEKIEKPKLMYTQFWKEYGKNIRLGILDDLKNRKTLIELLRFHTNKSEKKLISLKQYVERMKPNQKNIYYITGESIEDAKKSPFLEEIEKRGFEVLYLVDPIDEYILPHIPDYEKKQLQSISREGLEFGDEEEKKKQFEADKATFEPLTRFFKNLYPNILMKAEVSNRLVSSPLVLIAPKYGYSANMERIMRAQTMRDDPDREMPEQANRILEINPTHKVIIDLNQRISTNEKDVTALNMAKLLYETACLRSGYPVKNSAEFAQRVFGLIGGEQILDENSKDTTETKDEL